jgi:hypothetical protein
MSRRRTKRTDNINVSDDNTITHERIEEALGKPVPTSPAVDVPETINETIEEKEDTQDDTPVEEQKKRGRPKKEREPEPDPLENDEYIIALTEYFEQLKIDRRKTYKNNKSSCVRCRKLCLYITKKCKEMRVELLEKHKSIPTRKKAEAKTETSE